LNRQDRQGAKKQGAKKNVAGSRETHEPKEIVGIDSHEFVVFSASDSVNGCLYPPTLLGVLGVLAVFLFGDLAIVLQRRRKVSPFAESMAGRMEERSDRRLRESLASDQDSPGANDWESRHSIGR